MEALLVLYGGRKKPRKASRTQIIQARKLGTKINRRHLAEALFGKTPLGQAFDVRATFAMATQPDVEKREIYPIAVVAVAFGR
jgi:hypothetical protein